MRMKISHEKIAYKVVSKNLRDFLQRNEEHRDKIVFLATRGKKKKGPVCNLLEQFKSDFRKNPISKNLKRNKRGQLWFQNFDQKQAEHLENSKKR